MPRGQYDRTAAKRRKQARTAEATKSTDNGKPRLLIEIEFDDAESLMSSKDEIKASAATHGTAVRIEAHNMPAIIKF